MNQPIASSYRFIAAIVLLAGTLAVAQPTTAPAVDVDATLDRLHDVGATLTSLRADVTMATSDAATGADTSRDGTILIERRGPGDTRGHVNFTKYQSGNRIVRERIEYLLDGDWVVDRVYRKPGVPADVPNRETWRQIRRAGDKTDLLKLGAGPFPLPIGQPKETVREQFKVAPAPADPNKRGLTGIELTPREGTPLASKFHSILVWLKPGESMPSVIETYSPDESELKTTTLSNVRLNDGVTDADFKLDAFERPDEWVVVREPLDAAK